ncbi:PQQ-dependent sugar dehydrogenase [Maricaulis sp. CAU 1757]
MQRAYLTGLAIGLGLSLVVADAPAAAQTRMETVVEGLEHPWSLAFLPNGDMLVTEKPGRLRRIRGDHLVARPLEGVPQVLYSGQGGLLDVVLAPDFQTSRWVYLTWSEGTPDDNTLHLGRGRLRGDRLDGFETLFSATPRRDTDVHYGGRLVFLADGSMLLGIGDGFDYREQAQRASNHYGAFVHLNADGTPRPGPFGDGAPGVFSIGHRNPQAIVFDAVDGVVYTHEHGPRGGDEVNVLERGENYGWPIASHGVDYTGALVTPYETYPGMRDPLHVWVPSIAPAGMTLYRGDMFPEWDGDLLVAALIRGDADVPAGHVRRLDLEDGEVAGEEVLFGDLATRIRDVRTAPDGSIWLLTDEPEGQLVRISREP